MNANRKNIRHIDFLIDLACIMMQTDMPKLEEVPKVTLKKYVPKPIPKPEAGDASFDFTITG